MVIWLLVMTFNFTLWDTPETLAAYTSLRRLPRESGISIPGRKEFLRHLILQRHGCSCLAPAVVHEKMPDQRMNNHTGWRDIPNEMVLS